MTDGRKSGCVSRLLKLFLLSIVAVVLLTVLWTDEKTERRYVIATSVNLRSGPGTDYAISGGALQGDELNIIAEKRGWFQVTRDGQSSAIWIREDLTGDRKMLDTRRSAIGNATRIATARKDSTPVESVEGGDYAARIVELSPYTKDFFPKLFKTFGSRLQEIEEYRSKAAKMAIQSGKCDYVEIAELSVKSSLDRLKFWVDCRNGERIYLTEREIDEHSSVLTQTEKAWDEANAIKACGEAIKAQAQFPADVNIYWVLGTSVYTAPTTRNVVVRMDFDAGNTFRKEIPYKATCHFAPGEAGKIEIEPR